MQGCELLHHLLVKIWLVCVYSLGMLTEVVEAGELLRAMALEGAFAGMLSDGKREYRERLVQLGQMERRKCRRLVVNGRNRLSESRRMDRSVSLWDPHYEVHMESIGYVQGCTLSHGSRWRGGGPFSICFRTRERVPTSRRGSKAIGVGRDMKMKERRVKEEGCSRREQQDSVGRQDKRAGRSNGLWGAVERAGME